MNIGIIGRGIVGDAVYRGLRAVGHSLSFHDPKFNTQMGDVLSSELVFVCVPTNARDDGSCDTTVVESVIQELDDNDYQGIIAIKSTVIPGTTQRLGDKFVKRRICFVPEFLKEKSAEADFLGNMDVLIVGTDNRNVYETVVDIHKHLPKQVAKQLSPTEAELAKYFCNVYNALRITFASGMYKASSEMGADYQKIFEACIKRDNIDPNYLLAGPEYLGFGGKCLPKDTSAFAVFIKELGIDIELFDAITRDNVKHTGQS